MWRIRLTVLLLLMACGESSTDVVSLAITIEPQGGLIVGVNGTCDFLAAVTEESGQIVYSQTVTWSVENTSIATIDQNGLATGISVGTTTVTASVGEASRSVRLEVYVPEVISSYEVGKSYFGRNNYVEYIPGELPVIISAPHGGVLQPAETADRTYGSRGSDRNTVELSLAVRDAFSDATGYAPHVILSHLHRSKLRVIHSPTTRGTNSRTGSRKHEFSSLTTTTEDCTSICTVTGIQSPESSSDIS